MVPRMMIGRLKFYMQVQPVRLRLHLAVWVLSNQCLQVDDLRVLFSTIANYAHVSVSDKKLTLSTRSKP